MSVLLFANGEVEGQDWLRPYLAQATAVIAVDGGSRHLFALNHLPDLVVGDMDSLPNEVRRWLMAAHVPFLTYPAAKDETDLELALLHAVQTYSQPLQIVGGLGGRLDQTLANILLLSHPALHGRRIELITAVERAWLVTDQTCIQGQIGDTVSLIPLNGSARLQSTEGLQWPLHNETLVFGMARGVSNLLTAVEATVTLQSGQLLCIHMPQTPFWEGDKNRE